MININNYIRMMNYICILDYMKVCDEIAYINPAIYAKLRDDIGESTIDTVMHSISGGKEYAGYLGITADRDDWYKWHEETHTYSRRYFQEDGSFLIGAG